jgi:thiol-disulfide isomerase/thioredoxin
MALNETAPPRVRRFSRRVVLVAGIVSIAAVAVGIYFGVHSGARSRDVERQLTRAGKVVSYNFYSTSRALPEVRFENAEGKPLTLADFRGKVVLLNIWATWCSPCREEMPSLDHLQAKLGGPDFEVVALSIDHGGIPAVRKFFDEVGIRRLALYVDPSGQASSTLGAIGVPTTLLVDRAGRELWRVAGPVEWDQPDVIGVIRRAINASSKVKESSTEKVMQ